MKRERFVPYMFLSPALVLLVMFRVYPMLSTLIESLYTNNLNAKRRAFVGIENFSRVIGDPILWQSLKVTFTFNLAIIPIQVILALAAAVIANQAIRGISGFRSLFIIPVAVSPVVSATIWSLMLDKNAGIVNGLLATVGIPRQDFFLSKEQALWSLMIVASWRGIPYMMLFFLAGLQEIPSSLMEAASIDGASRWQGFIHVTLPLLRRVLAFVLVTGTILNLILFAPVWLITKGGPQLSTNLIMYETYRRGLFYGDIGGASAMLSIVVLIVAVIVGIEFVFLRTEMD